MWYTFNFLKSYLIWLPYYLRCRYSLSYLTFLPLFECFVFCWILYHLLLACFLNLLSFLRSIFFDSFLRNRVLGKYIFETLNIWKVYCILTFNFLAQCRIHVENFLQNFSSSFQYCCWEVQCCFNSWFWSCFLVLEAFRLFSLFLVFWNNMVKYSDVYTFFPIHYAGHLLNTCCLDVNLIKHSWVSFFSSLFHFLVFLCFLFLYFFNFIEFNFDYQFKFSWGCFSFSIFFFKHCFLDVIYFISLTVLIITLKFFFCSIHGPLLFWFSAFTAVFHVGNFAQISVTWLSSYCWEWDTKKLIAREGGCVCVCVVFDRVGQWL